jgi:hypothetical protein
MGHFFSQSQAMIPITYSIEKHDYRLPGHQCLPHSSDRIPDSISSFKYFMSFACQLRDQRPDDLTLPAAYNSWITEVSYEDN